jgi:hypothetical protein
MSAPALLSSQGQSFGISNAYKISIKSSRPSPETSQNDVSTLSIAHKGDRVYEKGLVDNGPYSTDGITVTVTVNTRGAPPAEGDVKSFKGKSCKCIKSETVNDAGKQSEGVAEYTSEY